MPTDYVGEAIERLKAAESELATELDRVRSALTALGMSRSAPVVVLNQLAGSSDDEVQPQRGPTVSGRTLALLDSNPLQGWTAKGIVDEYERRGTPIHKPGPDRTSAVRTALHNAVRRGQVREEDGTFYSKRGVSAHGATATTDTLTAHLPLSSVPDFGDVVYDEI